MADSRLSSKTDQSHRARRHVPARRPAGAHANFPIVGIGASAGGLDACRKFIAALPADSGMAFILVQHLDPNHDSMMVDLLATHTRMRVRQAKDAMTVEPDNFYIIPPGTYLSVGNGALHLSIPQARHGARLPFDFLLHSMAEEYGPRAIGVILSGTGADGSLGLKSVKERGGLVFAQDPREVSYDGMPRSAIATGAVDLVLPVAQIPGAIIRYDRRMTLVRNQQEPDAKKGQPPWLQEIVELLRTKTRHDFTLYKSGTLQRRIERRMAIATGEVDGMDQYLQIVRADATELARLARDLLINVTSFFRDPMVFDLLAEKIVPGLVRDHPAGQPLRIWIAGCSTGEETYSLAILFREEIAKTGSNVKLQVFASDIDQDAVASAREGLYSETIEADVSPARLARFFTRENDLYRVSPALRASVVFAVQDVLADPPYSRLDLVSCRNLLIYLRPEAQAKVISLFHFALRDNGVLLLGRAETIGDMDGRFALISELERLYRHIGHGRSGQFSLSAHAGTTRFPLHPAAITGGARQPNYADLCQQLVMEAYAPAAILINRKYECLHFMGPTDRYVKIAPGRPIHDLLAMARDGVRTKLRSAIQRACAENTRIMVAGGQLGPDSNAHPYSISVQPVMNHGGDLLLICFKDEVPEPTDKQNRTVLPKDVSRVAELEQELEITRIELRGAIHSLELSSEEQKAINEEALSVNEEFQSTNEELLTSKEELQSLNEELTALNNELQETLELQRIASNDLQNILYSTDVATIFLDSELNIRFFTPAPKALFKIIPGDIGRPLADLSFLAYDDALLRDAATVLRTQGPIEQEIEARGGLWYLRQILPYRTQDKDVEGVVITFADITERKRIADALTAAERSAQLANTTKSRFLAAASHDLRQPLQTLVLLQGHLAKPLDGPRKQELLVRLGDTLDAMSSMLGAMLDINQIEAGTVHAEKTDFPLNTLLDRLRNEFSDQAKAHGIQLRVVRSGLSISSDARLLNQMIRNLLSNALKYTESGKVLLGCRHGHGHVSIEIWDSGPGIAAKDLEAIFEEYHQLDNPARDRARGLGLGLFIVKQLGRLLDHPVRVRSWLGKGSVFAIDVAYSKTGQEPPAPDRQPVEEKAPSLGRTGAVLVIEDDPGVRDLLETLLKEEGHYTAGAADGAAALQLVARGTIRPDLIVADYNLPGAMSGLEVSAKLRERLHRRVPVVVLTGDISNATLRIIAGEDCIRLNKPVKSRELTDLIQELLLLPRSATPGPRIPQPANDAKVPVIFVVDDDAGVCGEMRSLFEADGRIVETFATSEAFLQACPPGRPGCLLLDAYLPGMSGLALLRHLRDKKYRLPAIMITGNSDVAVAVEAMKAGALDFIEKPLGADQLLASVRRALEHATDSTKLAAWREDATRHLARLTPRQSEIMAMVLAGQANKNIATDLGISQRTVENHRASIMRKTGAKSLPALARLALAAAGGDDRSA